MAFSALTAEQEHHKLLLDSARTLLDIGFETRDLHQAEGCLRQACSILSVITTSTETECYYLLLQARHRLGQILALKGQLEEASQLLLSIVNASNVSPAMLAISWYDLGSICLKHYERADQALVAFQHALSVPLVRLSPSQAMYNNNNDNSEESIMVQFIPHALEQVEKLLDDLEGQHPEGSSKKQIPWSLEFLVSQLNQQQPGEVTIDSNDPSVWDRSRCAAGAA